MSVVGASARWLVTLGLLVSLVVVIPTSFTPSAAALAAAKTTTGDQATTGTKTAGTKTAGTKAAPGRGAASNAALAALNCGQLFSQANYEAGQPLTIRSIDPATGALAGVGQFNGPGGQINGIGLTEDGRYMYGTWYDAGAGTARIYRWDSNNNTTALVSGPNNVVIANATHGAVNPANGIYYFGSITNSTSRNMNIYGYNPATNTFLGLVATISNLAASSGAGNGDFVFDPSGTLYITAGSTTESRLVRVNQQLPTTAGTTIAATVTQLNTITTTASINGIAFAGDGFLYLSSAALLFKVNPSNGNVVSTVAMAQNNSVDMASCTAPYTIKAQKDFPDGRASASDQATLTITGGGITSGNTGTTTGNDPGLQTGPGEVAGPVFGLPGQTYTVTETGGGTQGPTYVPSWRCVNETTGAELSSGTGTTGQFQMPAVNTGGGASVVCTFTNNARLPKISLTKTAGTPSGSQAGATIPYTFTVTNTGNVPLRNITVTDPKVGAVTCPAVQVAPGASITCSAAPYSLTQADVDAGVVNNTATASGTPTITGLANPTATDSTSTPIPRNPSLQLVKTASPTTVAGAGATVTYTFRVTNSGNVTINNLAVNDVQAPPAGSLNGPVTCATTTLAPGASTTCTATYTSTQADVDNGSINDTATATGQGPGGQAVTSNQSAATVTVTQTKALSLTKTASPTTVSAVGQTVTYTFTVRNTGNVTLRNLTINDVMDAPAGPLNGPITCAATTLAPGATTTCTATYTTTQADLDRGRITNTATATGTPPTGANVTSPSANATVTATQTATLTLTKAASPTTVSAVGQTVTYTFTVRNTGNVTINNLVVNDVQTPPAGSLNGPVTCAATTLAPNATTTCTATYTSTQADLDNGSINDTATATGRDPGGQTVTSNQSSATVNSTQTRSLQLTKSAGPVTVSTVGQTVTYTFAVRNTGNVTINNLAISDVQTAPAGSLNGPITCAATTLAPNATTTCTATYTVTQADLDNGSINDTATATGRAPGGQTVTSNQSTATVTTTQSTGLTLTKSAQPTTVSAVGDTVTYSFTVRNTGNVTLRNISVADVMDAPAGPLNGPVTCAATTLAPNASTTCTVTYTVIQADLDRGRITNSATATGSPPSGPAVTSTPATATVTATQSGALALTKTATPATVSAVGQTVTYTFAVRNSGNVTINNLAISDVQAPPAGSLNGPITCAAVTLAPGASTTCTATYTTTQADLDNGSINDTATATGRDPAGQTVTSNQSAATVTTTQTTGLTLAKSASPSTVSAVGQTVTYTFTITNNGNVTINNLTINDVMDAPAGPLNGPVTCATRTLSPNASTTCAVTYTTIQADLDRGRITNTATATGTPPTGPAVTSPPADAVVTAQQTATLSLTKTASPTTVSAVGQTVTYTFTVRNTGNVTINNLAVNDVQTPPAGSLNGPITCAATSLAPNATTTCTATYTSTQADLDNGSINDTATATGRDPGGQAVTSNQSTATVTTSQTAALTIAKAASPTTVSAVGQTVTYTFTVRNTGNVTLRNLTINDVMDAPAGPLNGPVTCATRTLAPNATTTCTVTYTTTQADLDRGRITNTATATGTPPAGPAVTSAPADATVTATQSGALALTKSAGPVTVSAVGQTVTYTFAVRNTGNVTINNLAISDVQTAPAGSLNGPITCAATTLAPGASTTCTATYTVTQADLDNGSINDTATATGRAPGGQTVTSNQSTATVTTTQSTGLTLTKSAQPTTVSAVGDTVTYSFTVRNTGNVTLRNISVADVMDAPAGPLNGPVTCAATTLAPNASTTCTVTYTVIQADLDRGRITNSATATGSPPSGPAVTSTPATATVTATQSGALALTKTATPATVSAVGQTVTYTFAVRNSGNVTINNLAISDVQAPPAGSLNGPITCAAVTLAPGASTTCTATYTTTQADLDNGSINDTATATGQDPAGQGVTSPPSSATVTTTQSTSLSLVKDASPSTVSAVGQTVTYTFTITNNGNVTIRDLVIDDQLSDPAGELDAPIECDVTTLSPGGVATCTATYTVTQADLDNGEINNSASATGVPPRGQNVTSPPDTAIVGVDREASLEVEKTASPASVSAVGDVITYTFSVTNTGNVTISELTIDDELDPPATGLDGPITCAATSVAPGMTMDCTATYTVTQADLDSGRVANTATASGVPPAGFPPIEAPPDGAEVDVDDAPVLELEKSASPASVSAAGDQITYTFTVTNTGNVTITDLVIDDVQAAPAGDLDGPVTCDQTTLAPGAEATCTATYTVTQADLDNGSVNDTATASGTSPAGNEVDSNESSATVPADQASGLALVKEAAPATVSAVGDEVTYTFTVTNTGNVTIDDLQIDDVQVAPAGDLDGPIECEETTLAPGAETTCTATYTVTQADLDNGSVNDTATASGTDPAGGEVESPESSATVTVEQDPTLTIVKEAAPATVSAVGAEITYTFTVTNTGNVTLTDISVADVLDAPAGDLDGPIECDVTTLAPGDEATCTSTYTVTQADLDNGEITNTATATGDNPAGDPVTSNEDDAVVTVDQAPELALVKEAAPTTVSAVGDVIDYTFTVTNTGNVTIDDLQIDDVQVAPAGDLDGPIECEATTLAPGAETTCTATYTVTQADLDNGSVNDTATASGTDPAGEPVESPESSATVTVEQDPTLTIVKEAAPATVSAVGDEITYTFTVTNTGNVTLTDISVADVLDAPAGDLDGPITCDTTTLAPGAEATCTATYTVTQADLDNGEVTNTATATGDNPAGDPVTSNEDDAVVTVDQAPELALVKEAAPTTVSAVGDVIDYTFTVTNTGNVTIDDLQIDDVQVAPAGDLDGPITCDTTTLAPGGETECTATYTVTQADLDNGSVNDTATASGTDPAGEPVESPESSATVPVDQAPGLELVKEASPATVSAVGDEVTYTFTVTNTGNVTIDNLAIEDELDAPAGDLDGPIECEATTLAPGADTTCTATYTVTQADLDNGEVTNTATATGDNPAGDPVTSNEDDAVVTVDQAPELTLVKEAAPTTVSAVGDVIDYTFTVTNTGNVTIDNLTIDDELDAPAGDLDGPIECEATTLAPGADTTCTATYTVTQADLDNGEITNTATATGDNPAGDPVTSNEDDAVVTVDQAPELALVKEAAPTTVSAVGDVIDYTFTVTNTGNVTIDDLQIDDVQVAPAGDLDGPVTCDETSLAPGAEATCTATYTVTQADLDNGSVNDTATASGTDPAGEPVESPESSATVTVEQDPTLTIVKEAAPATVSAVGDEITYTFTVTNTGNVTLTDISVADVLDAPAGDLDGPITCDTTTLTPGAEAVCTATYTVTQADLDSGEITNTATASGTPPTGPQVESPPDDATVDVEQDPALELEKSADPTSVAAVGDQISYTFAVTNTGNVTIDDLTIDDVQAPPAGALDAAPVCATTTLEPGAQTTCTATYTVTQADLDNGDVTDTATATGTTPQGEPVESDESTAVVTTQQTAALDLVKAGTPDVVTEVGEVIDYTFTVTNTGNVTLTDITVDDIQQAPAGDLDGPIECPTTTLAPGESVVCTASYTVTRADLENGSVDDVATATGTTPGGDPVTSPESPYSIPTEAEVSYEASKTADPPSGSKVAPGDVVTYTLRVENTGQTALTLPVSDDLSDVLDDARYNRDVESNIEQVRFDSPRIRWEGSIEPGQTLVISYSVTVKPYDQQGDHQLVNSVVVHGPGGDCPPPGDGDAATSAAAATCGTTHTNPPPEGPDDGGPDLPDTGGPDQALLWGGLAAVLAGLALLLIGVRRRRGEDRS